MSSVRQLHRRALRILLRGGPARYPAGRRGEALRREIARFNRQHAAWLGSRDLEGFSFGRKLTGGEPTEKWALIVYVRRKTRPDEKPPLPVPKRIQIPGLGTFLTDVVQLGEFKLHAPFTDTVRPVVPGCCLGLPGAGPGTLGCIVHEPPDGPPLLLSCAHVFTDGFQRPLSEPVEQTAWQYQPAPGNYRVATVREIAPVRFNSNINDYSNEVDAGLATLDLAMDEINPLMLGNGPRPATGGVIDEDIPVRKMGFAGGVQDGVIIKTDFYKAFLYRDPATGADRRLGFRNLVLASYHAEPGDSGSAVLDGNGHLLGIHIGSWSEGSLFCRFDRIAYHLGVAPY